jgi:hypothetical protein
METICLDGGCLCGAIRYRVNGPVQSSSTCFCNSCRRASGASPVAWFVVALEHFELLQGEFASHRSSPPVRRCFCGRCGSALAYLHDDDAGVIELTTCTLDEPSRMPPTHEIWHADRVGWVASDPGLPHHLQARDA